MGSFAKYNPVKRDSLTVSSMKGDARSDTVDTMRRLPSSRRGRSPAPLAREETVRRRADDQTSAPPLKPAPWLGRVERWASVHRLARRLQEQARTQRFLRT